jgi:hypothetical protein
MSRVACPFFLPVEKLENAGWLHAHRLPLGAGWAGRCTAPTHEDANLSNEELREFCNLGYASQCARLPRERAWDSVRFGAKIATGNQTGRSSDCVEVRYICERDHLPAAHGRLEFYPSRGEWGKKHFDHRVQRLAECFLESWLEKKMVKKKLYEAEDDGSAAVPPAKAAGTAALQPPSTRPR